MTILEPLLVLLHPARRRAHRKRLLEQACRDCGVSRTIARRIASLYFSELAGDATSTHNERVRG